MGEKGFYFLIELYRGVECVIGFWGVIGESCFYVEIGGFIGNGFLSLLCFVFFFIRDLGSIEIYSIVILIGLKCFEV